MARCWRCGAEVTAGERYCMVCGAAQGAAARQYGEQPPLVLQPAGAGMGGAGALPRAVPVSQPRGVSRLWLPLVVLLLLAAGVYHYWPVICTALARVGIGGAGSYTSLPVLGGVGVTVAVGKTTIGVVFADTTSTAGALTPRNGQFIQVGALVSNTSDAPFTVDSSSLELLDAATGTTYPAIRADWGTVDEVTNGAPHETYSVPPRQALSVAGILYFDVPPTIARPRLLVRDLSSWTSRYTGTIELANPGLTPPAPTLTPPPTPIPTPPITPTPTPPITPPAPQLGP